ncbi:hypothetical protein [Nakamurella endophytica]|uniref:Uncharacterized protein n=1 Tax=Nakamurella endophytica TaxID=1748367 RepID=A0A917WGU8_9ACTN|nr:hypothetical protein [Nakamurella endophytica]GGM02290.1 hypothetical protein GCM10011594_22950 [Nakamurella endophytica]
MTTQPFRPTGGPLAEAQQFRDRVFRRAGLLPRYATDALRGRSATEQPVLHLAPDHRPELLPRG